MATKKEMISEKPQETIFSEEKNSQEQSKTFEQLFPESDIIYYSGPIGSRCGDLWYHELREISPKSNVVVFICTCGGDPDSAFRMMRLLQRRYKKISVYVFGECYSAGTLFTLGADEIFMSENAQLGPLDVQLRRDDELFRMSGECYRQALQNMSATASVIFMDQFTKLKTDPNIPISTATASRVASEIAIGLLSPITHQIEPSKLGEVLRAQNIGLTYGLRLMRDKYNSYSARTIVMTLACGYSSHSTVIDLLEAQRIGLHAQPFDLKKDCGGLLQQFSDKLENQLANPVFEILNTREVLEKK